MSEETTEKPSRKRNLSALEDNLSAGSSKKEQQQQKQQPLFRRFVRAVRSTLLRGLGLGGDNNNQAPPSPHPPPPINKPPNVEDKVTVLLVEPPNKTGHSDIVRSWARRSGMKKGDDSFRGDGWSLQSLEKDFAFERRSDDTSSDCKQHCCAQVVLWEMECMPNGSISLVENKECRRIVNTADFVLLIVSLQSQMKPKALYDQVREGKDWLDKLLVSTCHVGQYPTVDLLVSVKGKSGSPEWLNKRADLVNVCQGCGIRMHHVVMQHKVRRNHGASMTSSIDGVFCAIVEQTFKYKKSPKENSNGEGKFSRVCDNSASSDKVSPSPSSPSRKRQKTIGSPRRSSL